MFPSTPLIENNEKISRPPQGKPRRKAAPHPSAKRTGMGTPVTVTLIWRGGSDGWIELRSPQGRWFRTYGHCIGGLVEELVRGGHFVEDVPGSAAIRKRRAAR